MAVGRLRWVVRGVAAVALLLLAGLLALQSDWGKARIRDVIVTRFAEMTDGELIVDRLDGPLWSSATLHGIRIVQGGNVVLAVDRLTVSYRLGALLSGHIALQPMDVEGLRMTVVEEAAGWRVRGLAVADAPSAPAAPGTTLQLRDVHVAGGRVEIVPANGPARQLEAIDTRGDVEVTDGVLRVTSRAFQARETTGNLGVRRMTGTLEVRDGRVAVKDLELETDGGELSAALSINGAVQPVALDGRVRSQGLLVSAFAPYIDGLAGLPNAALRPAFDLTLTGAVERVRVTGSVRSESGDVILDVVVSMADRLSAAGGAQVTRLDFGTLMGDPELASRFSGRATFDVQADASTAFGVTGTFDARLDDARMFTYQASGVRANGRLTADGLTATFTGAAYGAASQGSVTWTASSGTATIEGRVSGLDFRRVPGHVELPPLDTAITAVYRATAGPDSWVLNATVETATVEGAQLSRGTVVDLESRSGVLSYHTAGRVTGADTQRLAAKFSDVAEWLRQTPVALDTAFESRGTLGTDLGRHEIAVTFDDLGASIDGARVDGMSGRGQLSAGRLTLAADGDIAGDWDRVLRLPDSGLQPRGHATVDLAIDDVTAELAPEAVRGGGRVVLGPSRLMGYDVVDAALDARWQDGLLTFTDSRASVGGVALTASGTLALLGDGTSGLTFSADTPDLSAVGALAGVELAGAGHVEGRVTGPATQPHVTGTARATQLTYDTTRATSVQGTFDLDVPDWDPRQLQGRASAEALLVDVAGASLDRASAGLILNGPETDISVAVEQQGRRASLAGRLVTQADRRELVVRSAEFDSAGQSWRLVPGTPARISQAGERLTVDGVRLANGDQRVTVQGALGAAGTGAANEIVLQAEAVVMESLLEMLTGETRVHGRLAGQARVTGSLDAPQVSAQFTLANGSADGVAFRSFAGTAEYRTGGATIDVQLDAGDSGTFSATGSVPVGEPGAGGAVPLNLHVTGHLSNIAVLGPALPMLADLTGAIDADVRVTGTVERPLANGPATLTGVGFRVPSLGVRYRALNGTARFDGVNVVAEQFAIQDEDGHELRVDGSLDVLSGVLSPAVNLRARASGFHVMNNEFGELVVSTDVTVGGDLRAPLVQGTVRVERGLFEVDRLLREYVLARGYEPIDAPAVAAGTAGYPFAGATINVDVTLPANVVVRGRGIRTEEGTLGLGDINLTVEGQLRLSKSPGEEASLLGEVQAVRGTYDFQGRRFAITRGSLLRFRGDDWTNPALDITAEREIAGVAVRAHIRGTAAEPTLTLSSQPSLEESDILALVVFGRPISQLGEGQRVSLAATAGTIAAGALATPLTASVARALDLDVFEVEAGGGIGAGTSVLVGRQLSDKLFVGFRHKFGAEGGQRLTLEYRLTQFLRVVSTIAPGGDAATLAARSEGSGIDLILVIRR